MERRELLKVAALTAFGHKLQALPHSFLQAPLPAPNAQKPFFTKEESGFLDEVMELIIPQDEHSPGAHAAQTNLFADLMVGASADTTQKRWKEGIRLMKEEAQATSLAEALHKASRNEEHPQTGLERFFVMLKQMTVDGYYTSSIGIHQEMEYRGNAYLGAFPACTQLEHPQT
jgi:hypothetical protein